MATRPVFVPSGEPDTLVLTVSVEFAWHAGMRPSDKKMNVAALHQSAQDAGLFPLLEVSTKSEEKIGQHLSAFNLKTAVPGSTDVASVESVYQGSKVFADGGPYTDLMGKSSLDAKRDPRLKTSGALMGFQYGRKRWSSADMTSFYDWLYLSALQPHQEYLKDRLFRYHGFTDIEFNPSKSLACQARTCAILVSLLKLDTLDTFLDHQAECFLKQAERVRM